MLPRLRSKSMTAVPTAGALNDDDEDDTTTDKHDRPSRRASLRATSRISTYGGVIESELDNDAAAVLRSRGRPSKLTTNEEVLIFDLPGREHAEWLVKRAQEELGMFYMRWKRSPVRSTHWITSLFRCKDYNVRRLGTSKDRCQSQIYFTYDAANNKVYGKWRWHHPSHAVNDYTKADMLNVVEMAKKVPKEALPPLSPAMRVSSSSESRSRSSGALREAVDNGSSSVSPLKRKYEHLGDGAQTRAKKRSLVLTKDDSRPYLSPNTTGSGRSSPEGQLVHLSEHDKVKNFKDGITLTLHHLVAFVERADPEQWLRIGSEEMERDYLILRKMGSRIFNKAFNLEP